MITRLGNVVYWAFCLIGIGGVIITLYSVREHGPWEQYGGTPAIDWGAVLISVGAAIVIVVVGWSVRYILSGNKSLKP